jgi:hypothetical protein
LQKMVCKANYLHGIGKILGGTILDFKFKCFEK